MRHQSHRTFANWSVGFKKVNVAAKRKKGDSGHVTPRKPVQFPEDWLAVAKELASKRRQPIMWTWLGVLGEAAEKEGIAHPPYPWEI